MMNVPFELPLQSYNYNSGSEYRYAIRDAFERVASDLTPEQAAYIVTAVNNHEYLVKALETIDYEWSNRGEETSLHVWNQRMKAAIEQARFALAAAKEQK